MFAATTLISATVEAIDPTGLNITVQSVRSREKLAVPAVPAVSSGLVKGIIRIGDHVRLELDMEGRVVSIRKVVPFLRGSA